MTIGVGVIGLGFMGRTHLGAYRNAGRACRIAGVFDLAKDRLTGEAAEAGNIATDGTDSARLFDPDEVFATDSLAALLARPDIDAVSVCTPTDTHGEVARAAMRAGKHVLIEKPVSLDRREIDSLADEAADAGLICMPAMCMRFWPEWAWLKGCVDAGETLHSLALERIGTAPAWGNGFYQDTGRSGGAVYDLHIHDTDFVCHLLGVPDAVVSVGTRAHITTVYRYRNGVSHVVARGGWARGGTDFRMRYLAELQGGTADFDLLRDPTLMRSVVPSPEGEATEPSPVAVSKESGYDAEIAAFVAAVESGSAPPVTLADASATLAVLDAEVRSLESGREESV